MNSFLTSCEVFLFKMDKVLSFVFLSLMAGCVSGLNSERYIPQHCKMVNPNTPCVCKDEYGNYVDLRPLAWKNRTARFMDHPPADDDGHVYSFNPCYGFLEKSLNDTSGCLNVASCRVNKARTEFVDIGIQQGAVFGHFDNGNLSLTYISKDKKRTTILSLYCDLNQEKSTLRAVGDMGRFYWLQLRSKHCCPMNESSIQAYLGNDLTLGADEAGNITRVPQPPTVPPPVTITHGPSPHNKDLRKITFLLTGILIMCSVILLVLVGGLFWQYLRRKPYSQYTMIPTEDILENQKYPY